MFNYPKLLDGGGGGGVLFRVILIFCPSQCRTSTHVGIYTRAYPSTTNVCRKAGSQLLCKSTSLRNLRRLREIGHMLTNVYFENFFLLFTRVNDSCVMTFSSDYDQLFKFH